MSRHSIGPSHFIFYAAIRNRKQWLELIAKTTQTNLNFYFPLQLPLEQVLDDTLVDSFLEKIFNKLCLAEQVLFTQFYESTKNSDALNRCFQVSLMYGRKLLQESILEFPNSLFYNDKRHLSGIFQCLQRILSGGSISKIPLLLRRSTNNHLEYELLNCAHKRFPTSSKNSADIACVLESHLFNGSIEAIFPQVSFKRICKTSYCLDEVRIS